MKQKHQLLVLFLKTLYISAFTFGGGFVIVTFMKKCFVDELHWIDEQEMLDFTALAQSCPGAIAVNGAILVGWKVYGFALDNFKLSLRKKTIRSTFPLIVFFYI